MYIAIYGALILVSKKNKAANLCRPWPSIIECRGLRIEARFVIGPVVPTGTSTVDLGRIKQFVGHSAVPSLEIEMFWQAGAKGDLEVESVCALAM